MADSNDARLPAPQISTTPAAAPDPPRERAEPTGDRPSAGDQIGEAAGGISGVLTGAAIGAAGGPLGVIIGGIAGAVGGWWAGRAVSEAATRMSVGDDDAHYRDAYETAAERLADRGYGSVRPAYQLGHLAGLNPDYEGREFAAIEHELERGWSIGGAAERGAWSTVRGHARDAFARSRALRARPEGPRTAALPRER